jgi:hypothetical protein
MVAPPTPMMMMTTMMMTARVMVMMMMGSSMMVLDADDDDGVFGEDVQVSARARALKAGDGAGATVPAETRQVRCADAVAAEGGTQPLL